MSQSSQVDDVSDPDDGIEYFADRLSALNEDHGVKAGFCARCRDVVLPGPGTNWILPFAKFTQVQARSRHGCRLCGIVIRQFNLQRVGLNSERFKDWSIELSTRQDDPGKVYCRIPGRYNWFTKTEYIAAIMSVNYAPPPPPDATTLEWDVSLAKSKLEECVETHSCNRDQKLPTRLLDLEVLGVDRIKLIVTAEEEFNDRRYVALSYCWGFSTPFMTEPSNIAQRREGFALSQMPATLRQSVLVARSLGIRYLWIDALCILQGSRDNKEAQADWRQESARMNQVYGNAHLTIIAAGSWDSNGGLIHGRPSCTLPWRVEDSQPAPETQRAILSLDVSEPTYFVSYRDSFHNEPLFSRAWAQQEWLLSGRLLVFTSTRMQFVCDTWRARAHNSVHNFRLPKPENILRIFGWRSIVTDFCGRDMTEPTDKLPAISGLARRIGEIANGELGSYYAGLWENNLVRELLWRAEDASSMLVVSLPATSKSGRSIIDGRPRAPSWSWAAIDGLVVYVNIGTVSATVVRCDTQPAPEHDQFGQVTSGTLVIRCRYQTAIRCRYQTAQYVGGKFMYLNGYLDLDCGNGICKMWPDDLSETKEFVERTRLDGPLKLYCLFLEDWEGDRRGIVVRSDGKAGHFLRVGYFKAEHDPASEEREFEIR